MTPLLAEGWLDLLTDHGLRTVALGAALLGLVAGAVGAFAVLRRQSLQGDVVSHAALPGVALAVLLGVTVAAVNAAGVTLFFGSGALSLPSDVTSTADGPWQLHVAAVFAFAVGSAWAGVLAAGIFRSGMVGTAVVVAVPLLLAPVARTLLGDARHTTDGLPGRLEATLLMPWPPGTERWVAALVDLASRRGANSVTERAHDLLRALALSRDLHAVPSD